MWLAGTKGTWLRTRNGGEEWEVGQVEGADSLQFRDVHGVDAETAYLLSIGNGPESRIYKTVDGGESWVLQFRNEDPEAFYDCFDFWDSERALVIGDAIDGRVTMLSTDDGGRSWHHVPSERLPAAQEGEGSFAASGTCLETGPEGRAWVVASNGETPRLLVTSDYGTTWTVDTLPLSVTATSGPQSVGFRPDGMGFVLGGGYAATPEDTLAAIRAAPGEPWRPVARPPLASGIWGGRWVTTEPGSAPEIVAVGPAGIVRTTDLGRQWTVLDTLNHWSIGFGSQAVGWAVGAEGRITRLLRE